MAKRKNGTKINNEPQLSAAMQRHHDHFVRLFHQQKGELNHHDKSNYDLAMDREKAGLVKPLVADDVITILLPEAIGMPLKEWANIAIYVGFVILIALAVLGFWQYYRYEVALPPGGYTCAIALILAGLFFRFILRKT